VNYQFGNANIAAANDKRRRIPHEQDDSESGTRSHDHQNEIRGHGTRQPPSGCAALVVGLVLLMILTLLAISGMNTSTLELQMAGNFQFSQNAFQAAEIGLQRAMSGGKFATNTSITTPATLITGNATDHTGHVRERHQLRLREERRDRSAAAAGRSGVQHRREHGLLGLSLRSFIHRALATRRPRRERPGFLSRETGRRLPRLLTEFKFGAHVLCVQQASHRCDCRDTDLVVRWHALADDTEIFESTPIDAAAARPNILLIIDTSGSMVDNTVTQAMDYDPVTKYAGTCTNTDIYWKLNADPYCTSDHVARTVVACQNCTGQGRRARPGRQPQHGTVEVRVEEVDRPGSRNAPSR
jgi:hypothetical protein